MIDNQYIGRGENLTKEILARIFPDCSIWSQKPIQELILKKDFDSLDSVYQKHKFDFIVELKTRVTLAVEVNYHHGEGAYRKWNKVFVKILAKYHIIPVTIDDYDCRKKGLFYLNSKKEHMLTWDSFRDVIDALEKTDVQP